MNALLIEPMKEPREVQIEDRTYEGTPRGTN